MIDLNTNITRKEAFDKTRDNDDVEILKHRLETLLKDNVMEITFTKVDGTTRVMKCTLKSTLLPEETGKGTKAFPENILPVWDIDKNDWRSFRVDSVLDYITVKVEV